MSYMQYCLGLAALNGDSALTEDDALAYAIGSLDRLHRVKLPRCRKEVEDAIAALSDPNYVTMTQQWQERCDRLQAERDNYHSCYDKAVADIKTFLEVQEAYIDTFGFDSYRQLRTDANTKLSAESAKVVIFNTMTRQLANRETTK